MESPARTVILAEEETEAPLFAQAKAAKQGTSWGEAGGLGLKTGQMAPKPVLVSGTAFLWVLVVRSAQGI